MKTFNVHKQWQSHGEQLNLEVQVGAETATDAYRKVVEAYHDGSLWDRNDIAVLEGTDDIQLEPIHLRGWSVSTEIPPDSYQSFYPVGSKVTPLNEAGKLSPCLGKGRITKVCHQQKLCYEVTFPNSAGCLYLTQEKMADRSTYHVDVLPELNAEQCNLYDVTVFPVMKIKVPGMWAKNHDEAIKKALESVGLKTVMQDLQAIEDAVYAKFFHAFRVDDIDNRETSKTRWYGGDGSTPLADPNPAES